MSKLFLPSLLLVAFNLYAQQNTSLPELPPSKRFISKFELVGGPGLLLNYGNKNLDQHRAFKLGYCVGIGVYHAFSKRWELNARMLWERNGHKIRQRVNANIGLDEVIEDELKNEYYTLSVTPNYLIGEKKNFKVGVGCYYSFLKNSYSMSREYLNGKIAIQSGSNSLYDFETIDYGMVVQVGYSYKIMHNHSLLVQIVDKLGLSALGKPQPNPIVEKNHVVFIMLGFILS